MSNRYSLGGYRIVLQARTLKTILVEGKHDKELFGAIRILSEDRLSTVIDTQEILQDAVLSTLGAKARIDVLIATINTPEVREKIRCFVDREWEELISLSTLDAIPWTRPNRTDIRLKTSGHSIENYSFSIDFVFVYLRHFGGVASQSLLEDLSNAVPEFIRLSAAFSEVARKRQIVTKCYDILELADVLWDGTRCVIVGPLEQRVTARGGLNTIGFLSELNQVYQDKWSQNPFSDEAHLHTHGHIGEMILWLGVGGVAMKHGVTAEIAQEIALGRRDERRRVWHNWLCTLLPVDLYPIYEVFS